MADTDKFLQELEAITDKEQAIPLLIHIIRSLNKQVKDLSCNPYECRLEWADRLSIVENHVLGIGGTNGFKLQLKEIEMKLETIETEVQKWVVRATTAFLLFNLFILPLLIYVFAHLFPGGNP